ANSRIDTMESTVDALQPQIFCDDSGSADGLTDLEARCQDRIAMSVGKLFAAELKCLTACRKKEFKSRVPAGSCTPPVSDQRTLDCLEKVEGSAAFMIDRTCSLDTPECDTNDGAAWASMVAASAQGLDGGLFCGSPSGAFVD